MDTVRLRWNKPYLPILVSSLVRTEIAQGLSAVLLKHVTAGGCVQTSASNTNVSLSQVKRVRRRILEEHAGVFENEKMECYTTVRAK